MPPSSYIPRSAAEEAPAAQQTASMTFYKTAGKPLFYTFYEPQASSIFLEMLGKQPAANGLLDLEPYVEHAEWQRAQEQAQASIDSGQPYTVHFHVYVGNQTYVLEEVGFCTQQLAGQERVIQGVLRNSTVYQQGLDELHQMRLFYESTMSNMPLDLVVMDTDQRYVFVNKSAIKNAELRKWIIGKTDIEYCLYRGIDPEMARIRELHFKKAMTRKAEVQWEENKFGPEGKPEHSLKRYSPIVGPEGNVLIVLGYGFNITDIRLAEQRAHNSEEFMRSLAENVNHGIFRWGKDGQLLFANTAFYEMLPEALAQKLQQQEYDDETNALSTYFWEEEPQVPSALPWLKTKREDWLVTTRTAEEGQAIDGVVVNVRELKAVQADLQTKNIELEKAYTELDKFVYSASHDMRAPLTSIMGILKIVDAEQAQVPNELAPYLDMIKTSIHKLDAYVIDLIKYYRNKRTEVERSLVQIPAVVQNMHQMLQHVRPELGLTFTYEGPPELGLLTDANRLNVILTNLISNAATHQTTRGGFVRTRAELTESSLRLHVEDNGPGIAEHHLTHIFEMFYRANPKDSGTGLGLYIAYEAAAKLGGTLSVNSTLGQGTTFTLEIPIDKG